MMNSGVEYILHITGPLRVESSGQERILLTKHN